MSKPGCEYYWFLHGCRPEPSKEIIGYNPEREAYRKSIGNYFETKEEAEKAVERLRAWKKLKDGGVKFDLATLSDDTTIVMFARKRKHIHDYDKEIFMLFEDKE